MKDFWCALPPFVVAGCWWAWLAADMTMAGAATATAGGLVGSTQAAMVMDSDDASAADVVCGRKRTATGLLGSLGLRGLKLAMHFFGTTRNRETGNMRRPITRSSAPPGVAASELPAEPHSSDTLQTADIRTRAAPTQTRTRFSARHSWVLSFSVIGHLTLLVTT